MKNLITYLSLLSFMISVHASAQNGDYIYHNSIMDGMRNGIYEGHRNVRELGKKGDFGLGTYNFLEGEMVALDGVFYRIKTDGSLEKASALSRSPFNAIARFKADTAITFTFSGDLEKLQNHIRSLLPSQNLPYAVHVRLTFKDITAGGAEKLHETDTTGLAELMTKRPLYKAEDIKGTMVGFYNPAYMSNVDLSPFHFHFIDEDKNFGGHLVQGVAENTTVQLLLDEKDGYLIELLRHNNRFRKANFEGTKAQSSY